MSKSIHKSFLLTTLGLTSIGLFTNVFAESGPIGTVLAVSGKVEAIGAGTRELSRGSKLFTGDKVITGAQSGVQIRFSDNGLVALRANAEYQVNSYEFKGNSDKNANFNSTLVKGKMLALTGAITKANPKGYTVKSKLATISVNGTDFSTEIPQNAEFQMLQVTKGTVEFSSFGGAIPIGQDALYSSGMVTENVGIPVGVTNLPSPSTDIQTQKAENSAESSADEEEGDHEDADVEDFDNLSIDQISFNSFFQSFEPGLDEEADEHDISEAEEDELDDEEEDEFDDEF